MELVVNRYEFLKKLDGAIGIPDLEANLVDRDGAIADRKAAGSNTRAPG